MKPNRNIERRLRELERKAGGTEITLRFADGSSGIIRLSRGRDACDLFASAMKNPDGEEATLIRQSSSAIEPGGGRMIELCQALLPEPVELMNQAM